MKLSRFIIFTLFIALSFLFLAPYTFAGKQFMQSNAADTVKKLDGRELVKCSQAPIVQVVNNSGTSIFQVKIGKIVFHRNLSTCFTGCSSGFKAVKEGMLKILVKPNRLSSWQSIGSIGKFEPCKKYALNIKKSGNKLCAALFERVQTDSAFNNDRTKRKIDQTCESFSTTSLSKKNGHNQTRKLSSGAAKTIHSTRTVTNRSKGKIHYAPNTPVIENVYFNKAGDHTRIAPVTSPFGSSDDSEDRVPLIRTQFGTRLTFSIQFTTDNVQTLRVRLLYESGAHSNLRPGEPQLLSDGKKRYRFQTSYLADKSEEITLEVNGINPGPGGLTSVQKKIEIEVESPEFQVRPPVVNDDTLEVTFRVKNAGDMDFSSGTLNLRYGIKGMPGNVTIIDSVYRADDIVLNRNSTRDIFTVILPESALQYDTIQMAVSGNASVNDSSMPVEESTHSHTWETRTFTINETLVDIFSSLFSGSVRVNNFETGHGDRSDDRPAVTGDSSISLSIEGSSGASTVYRQDILIPSFKYGSTPFEALVMIKDLNAVIDSRDLFFIRDGKLGLRITFDASARNEIEVWARDAIAHCWRDSWLPDMDLRGFFIEIMLTPVLNGQVLSYSALTMDANVNLDIPGHRIERYLERTAAREIENSFAPVFDNASVKETIENAFQDLINNPMLNIRHLIDVRGSGDTIVLTYR